MARIKSSQYIWKFCICFINARQSLGAMVGTQTNCSSVAAAVSPSVERRFALLVQPLSWFREPNFRCISVEHRHVHWRFIVCCFFFRSVPHSRPSCWLFTFAACWVLPLPLRSQQRRTISLASSDVFSVSGRWRRHRHVVMCCLKNLKFWCVYSSLVMNIMYLRVLLYVVELNCKSVCRLVVFGWVKAQLNISPQQAFSFRANVSRRPL
jgi:hypothetical protein